MDHLQTRAGAEPSSQQRVESFLAALRDVVTTTRATLAALNETKAASDPHIAAAASSLAELEEIYRQLVWDVEALTERPPDPN